MAEPLKIKSFNALKGIQPPLWGQLENSGFPFAHYAYLQALEESGSLGERTGWVPLHIAAFNGKKLQGASYLYEKTNSYGEYIFDWAWAEAFQRHRLLYYPKLVSTVPFTPATGPKLLFSKGADHSRVAHELIAAALQEMEKRNCSSLHYLFLTPEEVSHFEKEGLLIRHSFQYHWRNRGYSTFEDYLSALKPRKAKQVRREREQLDPEVNIKILRGDDLEPEHAQLFHQFYLSTIQKMGAIPYLTQSFFEQVFATMKEEVLLYLAEEKGTPIAGSLCYQKGGNLYGRYWGSVKEVRNLHFELCYYRPIEWAIQQKMKLFEAGAQGEHKIARGFLPELSYSAHYIRHPAFREAIQNFIEEEKTGIRLLFEQIKEHSPYKEKAGGQY